MIKNKFNILVIFYALALLILFFYCLTQIDLNLTLTRNSFSQSLQKYFQNIGYFQRPVSAVFYLIINLVLFFFYFLIVYLVLKKRITEKQVWKLIILTVIILIFSYPAFSYDIFNYMFYGRIITKYGLSPYTLRALDFPLDPWTRFMHWTQNTYPYGPFWLAISTPFSLLGFQKFIPTLLLFKGIAAASFLGTVYFFQKICRKINTSNPILLISLFAFNPLVLTESLISAHNDISMIFLSILGVFLLLKDKYILSLVIILLSIATKFETAPLIIIWVIYFIYKVKKQEFNSKLIKIMLPIISSVSFLYVVFIREVQPWYLLWIFPFVLLIESKYANIMLISLSIGLLGRYMPFLYLGNWDNPAPQIKTYITLGFLVLGLLLSLIIFIKDLNKKKVINVS